jgi:diguanylate cyclase (GGDEF)-like protein/PAS domain S-box-containing protein
MKQETLSLKHPHASAPTCVLRHYIYADSVNRNTQEDIIVKKIKTFESSQYLPNLLSIIYNEGKMDKTNIGFYHELLENISEGVYFVDRDLRITYWNKAAETITGHTAHEVTGLRCMDNILNDVDETGTQLCTDGCPLAATIADGLPHRAYAYMRHKKGFRIPVNINTSPIRDEHGQIIGAAETFNNNPNTVALNERIRELERMALVDKLTGIGNRRYADMSIEEKFSGLNRYNWPFGIVLCDIDDFKEVNDNYGHNAGDEMLKMVSSTLAFSIRAIDGIFRWGGDEFLAVIANVNDRQLYDTAERMRHLVEASALPCNGSTLRVTISAGATLAKKNDNPLTLVQRADTLLYKSKAEGKNRSSIG